MEKENVYEKIEDEIVRFEKEGDSVEGIYISKDVGANFGNEVFKLKSLDGVRSYTIFSTSVLSSLMHSVAIGTQIKIVFTGTKSNKKKGQNDIKLFDVFQKRK